MQGKNSILQPRVNPTGSEASDLLQTKRAQDIQTETELDHPASKAKALG